MGFDYFNSSNVKTFKSFTLPNRTIHFGDIRYNPLLNSDKNSTKSASLPEYALRKSYYHKLIQG